MPRCKHCETLVRECHTNRREPCALRLVTLLEVLCVALLALIASAAGFLLLLHLLAGLMAELVLNVRAFSNDCEFRRTKLWGGDGDVLLPRMFIARGCYCGFLCHDVQVFL